LELNLVCTPIHRPNSNPVPYYAVCLNRTSTSKQDMGLVKTALILEPFEHEIYLIHFLIPPGVNSGLAISMSKVTFYYCMSSFIFFGVVASSEHYGQQLLLLNNESQKS
jgi:hypothetical protein